jgi:hypothetical protein
MQLLRWATQGRNTTPASFMVRGLDVANQTRAAGGGRKMFLTCPFIDQAVTLKFRLLSIDFGFERFSQSTSAYITHLIRKIRASLIHPKSAPQRVHIVQNVSRCLSSS